MELLALPAVAGLLLALFTALRSRRRAAAKQHALITRVYERRLLAACDGDKEVMARLVNDRAKTKPRAPRHILMKEALERLKRTRKRSKQ